MLSRGKIRRIHPPAWTGGVLTCRKCLRCYAADIYVIIPGSAHALLRSGHNIVGNLTHLRRRTVVEAEVINQKEPTPVQCDRIVGEHEAASGMGKLLPVYRPTGIDNTKGVE